MEGDHRTLVNPKKMRSVAYRKLTCDWMLNILDVEKSYSLRGTLKKNEQNNNIALKTNV